MINKELLKELAQKYGIGYSENNEKGGYIIDDSGKLHQNLAVDTLQESSLNKNFFRKLQRIIAKYM